VIRETLRPVSTRGDLRVTFTYYVKVTGRPLVGGSGLASGGDMRPGRLAAGGRLPPVAACVGGRLASGVGVRPGRLASGGGLRPVVGLRPGACGGRRLVSRGGLRPVAAASLLVA